MNTSNPFFIFENCFGKQIKCYSNENLESLFRRLDKDQIKEIEIYLNGLVNGLTYGADIEK